MLCILDKRISSNIVNDLIMQLTVLFVFHLELCLVQLFGIWRWNSDIYWRMAIIQNIVSVSCASIGGLLFVCK